MSRPKIKEGLLLSERLVVYLNLDDNQLLQSIAQSKGIPVAVLGRMLLKKALATENHKSTPRERIHNKINY